MNRKYYYLSLVFFLAIPAVVYLRINIINFFNSQYRGFSAAFSLLPIPIFWCLVFFSLIKAKRISQKWLGLILLGPIGLISLTLKSPTALHRSDQEKINIPLKLIMEIIFGAATYKLSGLLVDIGLNLEKHTAPDDMTGFAAYPMVIYLFLLFYLFRPLVLNIFSKILPSIRTQFSRV